MKKKQERIFELRLIDNFIENYPDVIQNAYTNGHPDLNKIQEYCKYHGIDTSYSVVYAILLWREYKQIYELDAEMAATLTDNDSLDDTIPVDVLNAVPYNCIYIRLPDKFLVMSHIRTSWHEIEKPMEVKGFYFFQHPVLSFYMFCLAFANGQIMSIGFPADAKLTLREAVNTGMATETEDTLMVFNMLLQFILYICAVNADIQENREQKAIYRKPSGNRQYLRKDRFAEIRKWDVGYRYGAKIRASKTRYESSGQGTGTGSKKRPHSRRGHYHHYWTGSKTEPSGRKLILKWIAPILVNTKDDNFINECITIHKVGT